MSFPYAYEARAVYILVGPDLAEVVPGLAEAVLGGQHVYLVGDYRPDLRFGCSASLDDHQQVEPAHSEGAQDV